MRGAGVSGPHRNRAAVAPIENGEPARVIDDPQRNRALPRPLAPVARRYDDVQLRISRRQIRQGVYIYALDKRLGCDQKRYRTIDSAIVCPIARTPARQHVLVERVVHANCENVAAAGGQQIVRIASESRVAFSQMLPRRLAVDPNLSRMEDCLELDAHGRSGSGTWCVELTPVPGDATIFC